MKLRTNCPYCSQLRPLEAHLHELGLVCEYLGNDAPCADIDSQRTVRTKTIGDWLKLASQLDEVKVDAWRFENDAGYCGTFADRVSSNSTHFTLYSTALTRFLFVSSALEETYRFVDHHYVKLADKFNIPPKVRPRTSSIRAASLVDLMPSEASPLHLQHRADQYRLLFARYLKDHQLEMSGLQYSDEAKLGYSLHLVRNLRNHIAHGVFPLLPNPDYDWGTDFDRDELIVLLGQSCRLAAMYMQMLLHQFNTGFMSDEYSYCEDGDGPEFDYLLEHCTVGYIASLHIKQNFSIAGAFDYAGRPWEEAEK